MAKDLFSSHPPTTPPTTEEDTLSALRLIRSPRVGATTFHRMIDEHGCVAAALDALPEVARAAGVRDYAPCARDTALRELDAARAAGATALLHGTPAYPAALAAIADAPPLLWAIGRLELLAQDAIAMVGARNASSLGTRMARRLAEGLGHRGFVIVSGLARGIDAAAHRAALPSGTVAVMAGGVDTVYPTENLGLYDALAETGLLLSEQPMGMTPQARHFPRRNRIISGLARAVIVVEAAEKSGSLITARDALDQGREVLAVPGHPVDGRAAGCNRLIREGATLLRGVEDVLTALAPVKDATDPNRGAPEPAGRRGTSQGARRAHAATAQGEPPGSGVSPAPGAAAEAPARRGSGGAHPASASPTPAGGRGGRAGVKSGAQSKPAPGDVTRGRTAQPRASREDPAPKRRDRASDAGAAGTVDAPGDLHLRILSMLGPSPVAEDQVIRDLGAPTQTVLAALVALEVEGRIARQPGAMLLRT